MRGFVWLGITVLLIFAWIGSFILYHVAGFLIHLLLLFAVISLLLHLLTGKRAKREIVRRDQDASLHKRAAFPMQFANQYP